MKEKNEFKLWI